MTDEDTPTEAALELNEVFAVLGHPRRRYLLYALAREENEESLAEIAARIASWERDKAVEEVTDDERRDVQVSLYHSHIPKLSAVDVLEFDESEDTIVRAQNTQQVAGVLDGAGAELDSRQETHARENDV